VVYAEFLSCLVGGPLDSVSFYGSQGHGGGILTLLHTGRYVVYRVKNVFEAVSSSVRDPDNNSIIIDLQHIILREKNYGS
jgi:hypothetical protein